MAWTTTPSQGAKNVGNISFWDTTLVVTVFDVSRLQTEGLQAPLNGATPVEVCVNGGDHWDVGLSSVDTTNPFCAPLAMSGASTVSIPLSAAMKAELERGNGWQLTIRAR